MPLTPAQIDYQARKASWYIQVDNHDSNVGGDSYVVTGNGVNDLDRLLSLMPTYPNGRYQIDVGTVYSDWRPCDISDVRGIREAYISIFGNVNKPGFTAPRSEAVQL